MIYSYCLILSILLCICLNIIVNSEENSIPFVHRHHHKGHKPDKNHGRKLAEDDGEVNYAEDDAQLNFAEDDAQLNFAEDDAQLNFAEADDTDARLSFAESKGVPKAAPKRPQPHSHPHPHPHPYKKPTQNHGHPHPGKRNPSKHPVFAEDVNFVQETDAFAEDDANGETVLADDNINFVKDDDAFAEEYEEEVENGQVFLAEEDEYQVEDQQGDWYKNTLSSETLQEEL